MFTLTCKFCKNKFKGIRRDMIACERPECVKQKHLQWNKHNTEQNIQRQAQYKRPKLSKLMNRQCQYENYFEVRCTNKTGKNYFFCDKHFREVDDCGMR
jgi:hypothetical protein